MLALEDVVFDIGGRRLLDSVSVLINDDERVGLVGPNGAGKTTLLRILNGEIDPDEGTVKQSNSATVGYLPQDGVEPDTDLTLKEEVETAFPELSKLEERIEQETEKLEKLETGTEGYDRAMKNLGRIQDRLRQSGAYRLDSRIEKVLMGLGFSEDDMDRPTTEFSGGWLMRIALAKLLLRNPTYLLLDEPTNHLDIESLQWLKKYLATYNGAVIIVSHDKAFLDAVTVRTLALEHGNLYDYAGNYSYYENKHEERREHLRKAKENQEREIREIEEFIDRFRYNASKASQVQSRIKKLEKMDRIELDERDEEISFQFPPPERSGKVVMKLDDVTKRYNGNTVFDGINFAIERGEKIAVLGPNGAGKSTLARIMAGVEPVDNGKREPGHNVSVDYFAQHQADELDSGKTAFEIMREADPQATDTRLRTILGCFLFEGDEVFKKVSVLSGGEKSRLALARMLLSTSNFLIFDEPTNHLDMTSKNILQQALNQYEGTCMIVSHDQDFLDPVVDKVLEVTGEGLTTYHGNVGYYLDRREERESFDRHDLGNDEADRPGPKSKKELRRIRSQRRKKLSGMIRPFREKADDLENEIEQLEERKRDIEEQMEQPEFYEDGDRVDRISKEYDTIQNKLDRAYEQWETLIDRIEEVRRQFKDE